MKKYREYKMMKNRSIGYRKSNRYFFCTCLKALIYIFLKLFCELECLNRCKTKRGEKVFARKTKEEKKIDLVEAIICEKYNSYYRMAYSYVHNEADAADIVQEGAYRAIKYCDAIKNEEYASTWIYRIMLNEVFRFLGAKKEETLEAEEVNQLSSEDSYENIDLKRALEKMSKEDQAVIQLKYFEDMKLEEIAEILGENINTIKSRLYRGLKKMRLELT